MDDPLWVFIVSLIALLLADITGAYFSGKRPQLSETEKNVLGVILTGVLTLYAVIIGFSFSMATARYDQRKNYEEAEANAIGTEYLRLGLLAPAEAKRGRSLMKSYLDNRILFYTTRDERQLDHIDSATTQLQSELWSIVEGPSAAQPTPVAAAIVTGMNDVLNSQSYTQAAWWNRIPVAAWGLIVAISLCCCVLYGFYATRDSGKVLFVSLPVILAITFLLLADLDSPRGGVILVRPQNLLSLSASLSRGA
jgi:hypothetical protein